MHSLTPTHINRLLFFKLPAAFWCGVRVHELQDRSCVTTLRYRWANQNPFGSIYFAALGMAAELATGALLMRYFKMQGWSVSFLVIEQQAQFYKKATGRIHFTCQLPPHFDALMQSLSDTEPQTLVLETVGTNEQGETVAIMQFTWSMKRRGLNKS